MTDPKTTLAPECDDCGLVPLPNSGPRERLHATLEVLRRLPESLFNLDPPAGAEGQGGFDVGEWDAAHFDELDGGDDGTPQYQIAKAFALERDRFVQVWRQAEALQLGLGRVDASGDVTATEGIHAQGVDLDRLLSGYGVGRPPGFTDCCYWRLLVLLRFKTQKTSWIIRELCALYTGVRPEINEDPAGGPLDLLKIVLTWPPAGEQVMTFIGGPGGIGVSYLVRELPAPPTAFDPYIAGNANGVGDTFLAPSTRATWTGGGAQLARGLTLEQAIALVKPAGVYVELRNRPQMGQRGCSGATLHGDPNINLQTDDGVVKLPQRGFLPRTGEVL